MPRRSNLSLLIERNHFTIEHFDFSRAPKNAVRATLEDMLRKTAFYVQTCAAGDLEKLLSSGFNPVSTNRAQTPLPQPTNVNVTNGDTTQLVISIATIPNVKSWEARAKIGDADWSASTIATNSRRITLNGLTKGEDYKVEVRAGGGSTGFSPWSDPVIQTCPCSQLKVGKCRKDVVRLLKIAISVFQVLEPRTES